MLAYEIRAALPEDEDELLEVARHLDTVNLPNDREAISEILARSLGSFSGAITDPKRREYVFVLRDLEHKRVIGTSMIIAQLGRRDAPYIYFDVLEEERYSASLDTHFAHTALRIGYSYNGPTEIGGLILLPEYRRVPERLGQFLSYVRFLFLAAHRPWFRDEILAELLPPLDEDGGSPLWDALGRKFTGLNYSDADFLSKKNKEFIKQLFPEGLIYTSLLAQQAQDTIGKVGAQTRGVEKMLRRIGFRYAHRVDPFDGGPHFTAMIDEITLVHDTLRASLAPGDATSMHASVVAIDVPEAPYFRAVLGSCEPQGGEHVTVGANVREHLGLNDGDTVMTLPLHPATGNAKGSPSYGGDG